VSLASQPFAVLWRHVSSAEINMALYYVLLNLWRDLLPALGVFHNEFLIRPLSVLASTLAAVVIYRIGARWWGRVAGIAAALAFASNPLLLRYAQEARGYALQTLLQTLLQALAWYVFLVALEAGAPAKSASSRAYRLRWWVAFAGISALAIYIQLDSIVCLAAFPIALIALALSPDATWRARARRSAVPLAISLAVIAAIAAPSVPIALTHGGGNDWVPAASVEQLVNITNGILLGGIDWMIAPLSLCVTLAILPVGLSRAMRRVAAPTLAALAWLIVPGALFWIIPHLFLARYLVIAVAPLARLVGVGVSRPRPLPFRLGLLLALALLLAQLPLACYAQTRDDYRTAGLWLSARIQPGDGMICWPETYCSVPMSYYTPELAGAGCLGAWDWTRHASSSASGAQVTAYVAGRQRIWLVLAPHGPHFSVQQEADERAALVAAGFTPGEQISTPQARIILYVRDSPM
jgi:mannosyltransferase